MQETAIQGKEKAKAVAENKILVKRLLDEVYCGDADKLDDYVAEQYVDHSKIKNREGLRKVLTEYQATFDRSCTIERILGENDNVAVAARITLSRNGTPQRTYSVTSIYRIENDKIVEAWPHSDAFF
jgi:predicted SnoaL-like aldol condensation-catalyzing enzyme